MAKKKINFEEAIKRLEVIVRELEDCQLPLEKALDLFSEGVEISKFCQNALNDAEQRIMLLTADDGGKKTTKVTTP